jgi:hypothetical protein
MGIFQMPIRLIALAFPCGGEQEPGVDVRIQVDQLCGAFFSAARANRPEGCRPELLQFDDRLGALGIVLPFLISNVDTQKRRNHPKDVYATAKPHRTASQLYRFIIKKQVHSQINYCSPELT